MLRLWNGDCLDKMKDISSNTVDLIICDLPFGCLSPKTIDNLGTSDYNHGERKISGCPWDVKIDLEAFWKEVKRIRRNDHTPCLHFTTAKYGYELIQSNEKEFRYDLIWDKGRGVSFLSANKMPMRSHECIYVFSKKGAYYNRVDISGEFREWKQFGKAKTDSVYGVVNRKNPVIREKGTITSSADKRCVLSVIENPTVPGKGNHPTAKPVELYKFLIERYCPTGGTVLDPTFGSGNSGLACQELGRHYIGIEKDKEFYEKAVKKLEKK